VLLNKLLNKQYHRQMILQPVSRLFVHISFHLAKLLIVDEIFYRTSYQTSSSVLGD